MEQRRLLEKEETMGKISLIHTHILACGIRTHSVKGESEEEETYNNETIQNKYVKLISAFNRNKWGRVE